MITIKSRAQLDLESLLRFTMAVVFGTSVGILTEDVTSPIDRHGAEIVKGFINAHSVFRIRPIPSLR